MKGVRAVTVALSGPGTCTACGACLPTCPTGALLPAPRGPLVVEAACTGCLACVEVCPVDALAELRVDALAELG